MKAVEATIDLEVRATEAIRAFIDPKALKGWWGVERCLIEEKTGGLYTLAWQITEKGFKYVTTGIVESIGPTFLHIGQIAYFNPERAILGPMTLGFDATVLGDNHCRLSVKQGGYQSGTADWDWYYEAVKAAWPQALRGLKGYLEEDSL